MNKATAADVTRTLVNAGYAVTVVADPTGLGQYTVTATATDGSSITASTVATFAANNSVIGRVYRAEFV